jgi:hypothetical protein
MILKYGGDHNPPKIYATILRDTKRRGYAYSLQSAGALCEDKSSQNAEKWASQLDLVRRTGKTDMQGAVLLLIAGKLRLIEMCFGQSQLEELLDRQVLRHLSRPKYLEVTRSRRKTNCAAAWIRKEDVYPAMSLSLALRYYVNRFPTLSALQAVRNTETGRTTSK